MKNRKDLTEKRVDLTSQRPGPRRTMVAHGALHVGIIIEKSSHRKQQRVRPLELQHLSKRAY